MNRKFLPVGYLVISTRCKKREMNWSFVCCFCIYMGPILRSFITFLISASHSIFFPLVLRWHKENILGPPFRLIFSCFKKKLPWRPNQFARRQTYHFLSLSAGYVATQRAHPLATTWASNFLLPKSFASYSQALQLLQLFFSGHAVLLNRLKWMEKAMSLWNINKSGRLSLSSFPL